MTLNRRSIKWLPKLSLVVAIVVLGLSVVVKATDSSPEIDMFNSLQMVSNIKVVLSNLF